MAGDGGGIAAGAAAYTGGGRRATVAERAASAAAAVDAVRAARWEGEAAAVAAALSPQPAIRCVKRCYHTFATMARKKIHLSALFASLLALVLLVLARGPPPRCIARAVGGVQVRAELEQNPFHHRHQFRLVSAAALHSPLRRHEQHHSNGREHSEMHMPQIKEKEREENREQRKEGAVHRLRPDHMSVRGREKKLVDQQAG